MGLAENITITSRQNYYSRETQARICYHAKMGKHYAGIIRNVFGSQKNRIKLVLNNQVAWSGPIETFFLCPDNVSQAFDLVALAPYLSDGNLTDSNGELLTVDEFYATRIDAAVQNAVNLTWKIANFVKQQAPNMEIGLYEAGPDFSSLFDIGNTYLTNLSFYIHRGIYIYITFIFTVSFFCLKRVELH